MEDINTGKTVASFEEREPSGFSLFTLWHIFLRFFVLIVIVTVIGAAAGLGFALAKDKTVYSQTKSVLFIAKINNRAMTTNISLSNRYMDDVKKILVTPVIVKDANDGYKEYCNENGKSEQLATYGGVSSGSIVVTTGEGESLVFTVSYKDYDKIAAADKLDAVIHAAENRIGEFITADNAEIKAIDVVSTLSTSNSFFKYVIFGVLGGLVVGVLLTVLLYILDNTVKDKAELERLTDATIVAYIDDIAK